MTVDALIPAAFLAGLLMFLAPCTLPIVPGYLAFIAGVPEQEAMSASLRGRIMRNAILFIVGFSVVFILFGVFAVALGHLLGAWRYTLARAVGLLFIFFGISLLGLWRLPFLSGEWRARIPQWLMLGTWQSSLFIGILFALGWSPCIGPILGSILFLASTTQTAFEGAFLLSIFSFGLAVPFLLCAWFMSAVSHSIEKLSSLARALQRVAGVVLICLGILMLGNWTGLFIAWSFATFGGIGYTLLLQHL